jgi:hypothetical protein
VLPAGTCRSLRDSLWFYASGVRLAAPSRRLTVAGWVRCRLLLEVRQRPRGDLAAPGGTADALPSGADLVASRQRLIVGTVVRPERPPRASDASLRRSDRNAKALAHIRVVRPSPTVHTERLAIAADQRHSPFRRVESRRGPCGHDRVRSKRAKAGPRGNRCPRTATAGAGSGWFVFDS